MFAFNPDLEIEPLARRFAIGARITIPDFLAPSGAALLRRDLEARGEWRQHLNSGDKRFELDRATRRTMSPEQGAQLDAAVWRGAREGHQYRYEALSPDPALPDALSDLAAWLASPETRYVLAQICGTDAVNIREARAIRLSPGDFITAGTPTDARDRAGMLLWLTPGWRIDWGGILLFHDQSGRAAQAVTPGFNMLSLFAVDQVHSIAMVTPAAPGAVLAVMAWLSAR